MVDVKSFMELERIGKDGVVKVFGAIEKMAKLAGIERIIASDRVDEMMDWQEGICFYRMLGRVNHR